MACTQYMKKYMKNLKNNRKLSRWYQNHPGNPYFATISVPKIGKNQSSIKNTVQKNRSRLLCSFLPIIAVTVFQLFRAMGGGWRCSSR